MIVKELAVAGAWSFTPAVHGDSRGLFLEWFQGETVTSTIGHPLELQQANLSLSSRGVLRGIHFADVPPGQAKYVTCVRGAVLDVVVDIRVGSPTFGQWDSVLLDDKERRAIYLSEGLGHAFMALEDDSAVTYLCSAPYAPGREHGIHPLDPAIAVAWPTVGRDGRPLEPELSEKDESAPTLEEAAAAGLLPRYEDVSRYVATLGASRKQ